MAYNRTKGETIRKAGQQTLKKGKFIMQEIGDDNEFPPLINITTTFIDTNGTPVPISSTLPLQTLPKTTPSSRISFPKQHDTDLQYLRIASQLRNNTKSAVRSVARKKEMNHRSFLQEREEDLKGVESIIGQIQALIKQDSQLKPPSFKSKVGASSRVKKSNWTNRPVKSFSQQDGFAKLEELLLNYHVPGFKQEEKTQSTPPDKKRSHRQPRKKEKEEQNQGKRKNEQIEEQDRKQQNLEREGKEKEEDRMMGKGEQIVEAGKEQEKKIEEKGEEQKAKQQEEQNEARDGTNLEDIQIVEIDWCKLPVIPIPLNPDNSTLFLNIKDHPNQPAYLDAVRQVLGRETIYKGYSIFDSQRQAGMNSNLLLSEQEFRQKWAQEWNYEVEQENNKQLIGEWDFQWYRCLVQLTYSHSLEDIFTKRINYDPRIYLQTLGIIHGHSNDKNKMEDGATIEERIPLNRLKFVEELLLTFNFQRKKKMGKENVMIGVIPSLAEGTDPHHWELIKKWVQDIFIGGIYHQGQAEMAVMVAKRQIQHGEVQRVGEGIVLVGKVQLLINEAEGQVNDQTIRLKREKMKNSWVHIGVQRRGEQQETLEVGEELGFGRRYRIDLD